MHYRRRSVWAEDEDNEGRREWNSGDKGFWWKAALGFIGFWAVMFAAFYIVFELSVPEEYQFLAGMAVIGAVYLAVRGVDKALNKRHKK